MLHEEKGQMKITKAQLEQMGEYEGDSTSKQTHRQVIFQIYQ